MKDIIQVINGIEYVLIARIVNSNYEIREFTKVVDKYNGIIQSADLIKGGWLGSDSMKISVLIPSKSVFEFTKEPIIR